MTDSCAGCGLAIVGGSAACEACLMELCARAAGDYRYARVHRLMVDVYAMQHPDRYCASAKSLAAHLTGLCCEMEHGAAGSVYEATRRWLDGPSPVQKPALPASRGALTIADVRDADPESYAQAVSRWAESTWEAYAVLHPTAREWVKIALQRGVRAG